MRRIWTLMAVASLVLPMAGCKKKKDGTGGGGGGAWLVGQDGSMFNLEVEGLAPGDYGLEVDQDLLGIACRGADSAWVVGERGLVLRTFDGGVSWDHLDLGLSRDLRDVAAAAQDTVYVVGAGVALVSRDSGDHFTALDAPALDWLSVTTDASGAIALMSAADGSIWRYDDRSAELAQVRSADGVAVHGVALTSDRRFAAAAGAGGLVLVSYDGGLRWEPRNAPVARTLHDVWLTSDGVDLFAVGEGGVLVRSSVVSTSSEVVVDGGFTLRAIHLSADGFGMAVGDGGTALRTVDRGRTWTPIPMGTDRNLYAVDDLHPFSHL